MNTHAASLDGSESASPVTKVGAAVLRITELQTELLVIQPKPKAKTPHDLPPIGLVRGTRMYRTVDGQDVDANHDGRTAPPADALLEPLRETLAREIEEEAGVTRVMLAAAQVMEMGPRLFASTKKTPYPIHWFLVVLDANAQAALPHTGFKDSLYSEWVTLETLREYVAAGKASRGYVAVAEEAFLVASR